MLVLNDWAVFFKVLFAIGAALTILMSSSYLEAHRRHLGEYYALLLFAVIGMDLMAAARDFILFYVALELMAISSYLLAAFFRYRVRSNESSLKYFLTGSFASAIMLYGISLVYAEAGATNYSAVGQALGGSGGSVRRHLRGVPGGHRAGLQGLGGAVPHVDPRRVPGRPHSDRGLLLGGPQGGRRSRRSCRRSSWPSRERSRNGACCSSCSPSSPCWWAICSPWSRPT